MKLFPEFDFQDEEWDSWGYNYWLVVFNDCMIIAFFHLTYQALEISVNFFSLLSGNTFLKQLYE